MDQLWLKEEDLQEVLKEHFLPVKTEFLQTSPKVYYLSVDEKHDNSERDYLKKFLFAANTFPLYLSLYLETNNVEEYLTDFDALSLEYNVQYSLEKRIYHSSGRIRSFYHPAYITVKFMDIDTLSQIINDTYIQAVMNDFYAISSINNVQFHYKKRTAVVPLKPNSFYISIGHDGHGFYLFSNEKRYSSINRVMESLPAETELTQINDKLVEELE